MRALTPTQRCTFEQGSRRLGQRPGLVDLVPDQQAGRRGGELLRPAGARIRGVDDPQDCVGGAERSARAQLCLALGRAAHGFEAGAVLQQAQAALEREFCAQQIARRSRLRVHERLLAADERVEECALARVGRPGEQHARLATPARARGLEGERAFEFRAQARPARLELGALDVPRVGLLEIERRLAQGTASSSSSSRSASTRRASPPADELERRGALGLVGGEHQFEQALGAREVDAAGVEGAARELARLRRARAQFEHAL
ncbi:MAG: hypothetical protein IPJ19_12485 [Planctomycetes bacterium]|nr:hypothetical protein [Planctomycetota bacterium]